MESVSQAAIQIREALAPLAAEAEKASGSKKGAITKHINKVLEALLGGELEGDDAELVAGIDSREHLEKARELGNGLLRELSESVQEQFTRRDPRACERPLPEGRRSDAEGRLRGDHPVVAEGS